MFIISIFANILAWLEAVELYERMKTEGGAVKPNFISMNSLLIVLERFDQVELAETIYKEALRDKFFSPWRFTLDSNYTGQIRVMVRCMTFAFFGYFLFKIMFLILFIISFHNPTRTCTNILFQWQK